MIEAGPFGAWLEQARAVLRGEAGAQVPCGDCTGCCTSGYSVQLRPTDAPALAVIPAELLVRAPGFAPGQLTMPARIDGHCPMLQSGSCSIYARRPQTCLDYDCRIFAAAGLDAGGADKAVINRRVRAWHFNYESAVQERAHEAVRAAAHFIRDHPAVFAAQGIRVPTSTMGIAVLAIKSHAALLEPSLADATDEERARAMIAQGRGFDA